VIRNCCPDVAGIPIACICRPRFQATRKVCCPSLVNTWQPCAASAAQCLRPRRPRKTRAFEGTSRIGGMPPAKEDNIGLIQNSMRSSANFHAHACGALLQKFPCGVTIPRIPPRPGSGTSDAADFKSITVTKTPPGAKKARRKCTGLHLSHWRLSDGYSRQLIPFRSLARARDNWISGGAQRSRALTLKADVRYHRMGQHQ